MSLRASLSFSFTCVRRNRVGLHRELTGNEQPKFVLRFQCGAGRYLTEFFIRGNARGRQSFARPRDTLRGHQAGAVPESR